MTNFTMVSRIHKSLTLAVYVPYYDLYNIAKHET